MNKYAPNSNSPQQFPNPQMTTQCGLPNYNRTSYLQPHVSTVYNVPPPELNNSQFYNVPPPELNNSQFVPQNLEGQSLYSQQFSSNTFSQPSPINHVFNQPPPYQQLNSYLPASHFGLSPQNPGYSLGHNGNNKKLKSQMYSYRNNGDVQSPRGEAQVRNNNLYSSGSHRQFSGGMGEKWNGTTRNHNFRFPNYNDKTYQNKVKTGYVTLEHQNVIVRQDKGNGRFALQPCNFSSFNGMQTDRSNMCTSNHGIGTTELPMEQSECNERLTLYQNVISAGRLMNEVFGTRDVFSPFGPPMEQSEYEALNEVDSYLKGYSFYQISRVLDCLDEC